MSVPTYVFERGVFRPQRLMETTGTSYTMRVNELRVPAAKGMAPDYVARFPTRRTRPGTNTCLSSVLTRLKRSTKTQGRLPWRTRNSNR